jgi:asparagine synthase (glutamine-hydrolysing)
MDGRLDNREALIALLLQHRSELRSRSDGALALAAYMEFGEDFPAKLDGDFAIVIWDGRARTAVLARDRFGVKPLFHHVDGNILSFASEVKPILRLPWVTTRFNACTALRMMSGEGQASSETLWSGIERVPVRSWLSLSLHQKRAGCYWDPAALPPAPRRSAKDHIVLYRALLEDSVRRQSRSDHPLAVEASGGLDSSAIAAIVHEHFRKGELPAPGVMSFTLGFEGDEAANDLPYARALSDFLGVSIIEVAPHFEPLDWYIAQARSDADFPGFPNGVMGHGINLAARQAGCRIVLSGIGGDEVLSAGSYRLGDCLQHGALGELLRGFREYTASDGYRAATHSLLRYGIFPLLPEGLQGMARGVVRRMRKKPGQTDLALLSPARLADCRLRETPGPYAAATIRSLRQLEMLQSLVDPFNYLAREQEDRAMARFGLEVRYPFFDRALVEHCLQVPLWLKERHGLDKWFHREAMRDALPPAILARDDKAEFSVVYGPYQADLHEKIVAIDRMGVLSRLLDGDGPVTAESLRARCAALDIPEYKIWTLFGCVAAANALSER